MTNTSNKLTTLEKLYTKDHDLNLTNTLKLKVDWNVIDMSTAHYTELLKEFDFAEIMKSIVSRYEKNSTIQILPMAGNIDYNDASVGFSSFFAALEKSRHDLNKKDFMAGKHEASLRDESTRVIEYLMSGKHSNKDLVFGGWRRAFNYAKSKKKKLLMGVLSVDIPYSFVSRDGQMGYKASGTQHYVSFAYELSSRKLYLFDSASKDPSNDRSEVYYILKYAFEAIDGVTDGIKIVSMKFPYILQPGAGDRKTEHEISYNNQNVFCHTWSLWFGTLVAMFYNGKLGFEGTGLPAFFWGCSHHDNMLNLAMIKRFAYWLSSFLVSDEDVNTDAINLQINRAQRALDKNRMYQLFSKMKPLDGMLYIWCFKSNKPILIEDLCVARKVKMDVPYVESELDAFTLQAFKALVSKKRCRLGYVLNDATKRCRKA